MNQTVYSPHPGKQTEFISCSADNVFFGGARGPGKSFALAFKAAFSVKRGHWTYQGKKITDDEYLQFSAQGIECKYIVEKIAIDYPDYVAILIRRTGPQLERNLKPECDKLYPLYGGQWKERHRRYVFPSGAMIYLVHCKDRRALDDYIGGNYNFIGFDEVNQFPQEWVDAIVTSNRTTNPELRPQACMTSNPGNIGHIWLKKTYVDRCPPTEGETIYSEELDVTYTLKVSGETFFDDNGVSWQYIPALVFENPSIMENDPGYILKLKNLKPTLKKMWLFGDWGAFVGMFFDKWDEDTHVIDMTDEKTRFRYNKEFSKYTHTLYRFYDYGTKAPFVCLFAAVDADDNITIFDEIVETGLASSAQARFVNEYALEKYNLTPDDFSDELADPQYWAKHSEKDSMPYSPEEHYADEGIYLTQGVRDREVGAKIIYDAFEPVKDGVPRIRFTSNCSYSIETIPALPAAELNPEDVDKKGEDHAYDALRYGGTIVLPGLTAAKEHEKGWRTRMVKLYAEMAGRGSTSESTWKSVL